MRLLYKTLLEVKLTHEYYITESDGTTFFSLSAPKDRDKFWTDQFTNERDTVNTDIDFQFPEHLQARYAQYGLKLLPSFSGCSVAVRVKQQVLADDSIVYTPSVPLPDDMEINIAIVRRNNLFDQYTNSKMAINVPAIYFFSNDTLVDQKTPSAQFPFLYLCNTISAYVKGQQYEQGELALFNATEIKENFKTKDGDGWSTVKGGAFANENDRLLVPSQFTYSFGDTSTTWAEFTLADRRGNKITDLVIDNSGAPFSSAPLDFSAAIATLANDDPFSFPDMVYSLSVIATNGYNRQHRLIFSDSLYDRKQSWAVINLKVKPANTEYRLTDDDGNLISQRDSAGVRKDAPVFEIPVTSRFTYWRYINDRNKELVLSADLTGCLEKENAVLITSVPRAIAKNYYLLPKAKASPVYSPNPGVYQLKTDDYQRFLFDVLVPVSDLFPIVT